MKQLEQTEAIQSKKVLRALNREIRERAKFQSDQEKQISTLIQEGNETLLDLNDVILQKRYEIKELNKEKVALQSEIDDLVLEKCTIQVPALAV